MRHTCSSAWHFGHSSSLRSGRLRAANDAPHFQQTRSCAMRTVYDSGPRARNGPMPKYVSSLELPLYDRPDGVTLVRWLHEQLRSAILEERLRPGTRLPATRDFARQYGIARGTVVEVFEQLISAGYLRSKVCSGTWVSQRPRARSSPRPRAPAKEWARPGPLRGLNFRDTARPFRLHEPAIAEFPIK